MSDLRPAISFAANLYLQKASTAYAAYVRRAPIARLHLRPGRENPYAIYDRIRAAGPLIPTHRGNFATASHRLCGAVLRDRRFGVREAGADPAAGTDALDLSFLEMNPPDHTRLRRLAQPAFSPKAVAAYPDRIERIVGGLLDRAAADGRFDLVSAFAAPLPIAVITELLGIPDANADEFAAYGATVGSALDGVKSLRHAARLQAEGRKLTRLFEDLFALRRAEPRDDLVSALVAADDERIAPAELLPLCALLLLAGFETTVNLIGNCVLALLDHPEQWAAVCADPQAMAAKAVEETLRYDPPVQATSRVALEPTVVEGTPVRRNQWIMTLIGGANRDPEVYDRPAEFDLGRENPAEHLAFSAGIHYCVGQPLARLEATTAIRLLAERMPGLTRAGAVRRGNGAMIRGPLSLPVSAGRERKVVTAAAAGSRR
jgi:cytochrome P450